MYIYIYLFIYIYIYIYIYKENGNNKCTYYVDTMRSQQTNVLDFSEVLRPQTA